jgi:hypothetical protein
MQDHRLLHRPVQSWPLLRQAVLLEHVRANLRVRMHLRQRALHAVALPVPALPQLHILQLFLNRASRSLHHQFLQVLLLPPLNHCFSLRLMAVQRPQAC